MLAVITGIIAATLYGNIGIKVIYNNSKYNYLRVRPRMRFRIILIILYSSRGVFLGASTHYKSWKENLGRHCSIVLEPGIYPFGRHSRLFRIDQSHCRPLLRAIYIHFSGGARTRLSRPKRGDAWGDAVRPIHRRGPPTGQRNQANYQRLLWQILVGLHLAHVVYHGVSCSQWVGIILFY